jgi:hypothetical protein
VIVVADVTGARGSVNSRIEDAGAETALRSSTATGEALVVPDGETLPALRQDQVPAGVPQASCTPLGVATIIDPQVGEPVVSADPAVLERAQAALDAGAKGKARAEQTVTGAEDEARREAKRERDRAYRERKRNGLVGKLRRKKN